MNHDSDGAASLRTYLVRTFGCQMNEHDSEHMAFQLQCLGLRQAGDDESPDLVVINTCSVRSKPQHKALSEAGRFKHLRQQRGTLVILAGCVAQQEGQSLLERTDFLDAVIGPDAVGRLPDIVGRLLAGKGPVLDVQQHTAEQPCFVPGAKTLRSGPTALVTIMKGCNNFCSYCIVPYVRGREVSRPADDILAEVAELSRQGCREVTLLGQNVNSYRDPGGLDFSGLLRRLERQAAVERIRFTTSHPRDVDEAMIAAVAECSRVCEHVHLGLQSGSDRILRAMNRGYRAEQFLAKVERLRRAVPECSVTTDIIVGFPGEQEADFEETLAVVRQAEFDQAFSFKYSPRPATAAARLPDDVPAEVKQRRLESLQRVIDRIERQRLQRLVGRRLEVLVEGVSIRDETAWRGRGRGNQVVNFTAPGRLSAGDLCQVEILEARGHTLWGRSEEPTLA